MTAKQLTTIVPLTVGLITVVWLNILDQPDLPAQRTWSKIQPQGPRVHGGNPRGSIAKGSSMEAEFPALLETDPASAADLALQKANFSLDRVVVEWSAIDPIACLTFFRDRGLLKDLGNSKMASILFHRAGVADFAKTLTILKPYPRHFGEEIAARGWASANPDEALARLGEFAGKARSGLVRELGNQRPKALIEKLGGVEALLAEDIAPDPALAFAAPYFPEATIAAAERLGMVWIESGPSWWLHELPIENRMACIERWRAVAIEAAADGVEPRDVWYPGGGRISVESEEPKIAAELANKDPDKANAWVEAIPAPPRQRDAYTELFKAFAKEAPEAASAYLRDHLPSDSMARDGAIFGLVMGASEADPQGVAPWILQMETPESKAMSLSFVSAYWPDSDLGRLVAFLIEAGFPNDEAFVFENWHDQLEKRIAAQGLDITLPKREAMESPPSREDAALSDELFGEPDEPANEEGAHDIFP